MSFYEIVNNPDNFSVNNPEQILTQNLRYLRAGLGQKQQYPSPFSGPITATTLTLTAAILLAGFIQQNPGGACTDTTDTAANLVAYLKQYIQAIASKDFGIQTGFYVDFAIQNQSGANVITLSAGAGVTLGGAITVPVSDMSWCRLTVLNPTVGSESVRIDLLG